MSQLSPAITSPARAEKRIHRTPSRPTLRLPRITFWPGFLTFATVGSIVMVVFSR